MGLLARYSFEIETKDTGSLYEKLMRTFFLHRADLSLFSEMGCRQRQEENKQYGYLVCFGTINNQLWGRFVVDVSKANAFYVSPTDEDIQNVISIPQTESFSPSQLLLVLNFRDEKRYRFEDHRQWRYAAYAVRVANRANLVGFDLAKLLPAVAKDASNIYAVESKNDSNIFVAVTLAKTTIVYSGRPNRSTWDFQPLMEVPYKIEMFDIDAKRQIYVISENDRICYVIDPSGKTSQMGKAIFVAVSPDGNFMAMASYGRGLSVRVEVYEGLRQSKLKKRFKFTFITNEMTYQIVWSLDSSEMAFVERIPYSAILMKNLKERISMINVQTGKKREVANNIFVTNLYGWVANLSTPN